MNKWNLTLCIICALGIGIGQILMKIAAGDVGSRFGLGVFSVFLSPWLVAAILGYTLTTALWVYVLTQVALTKAYPFMLLGAAIVPLLAWLLLKEPLTLKYALGMCLILSGLASMYVF